MGTRISLLVDVLLRGRVTRSRRRMRYIRTLNAEVLELRELLAVIDLGSSAYTQNFNTLAKSGDPVIIANGEFTGAMKGWHFIENDVVSATAAYRIGVGSGNTGDVYSFGSANGDDRALGGLRSNSLNPVFGAQFRNDNASPITELDISYVGEQWRLGSTGRTDRIDFQYSVDATSLTNGSGTWTDHDGLDFTAPVTSGTVGALDGNTTANRTTVSSTISGLNIAAGATFWIRWTDLDAVGADDGLAVDNFSITASAGGTGGGTQVFISEVVFDPESSFDTGEEYIELRGTPNAVIADDFYLVLLEGDSESNAGLIDHVFSIGGMQIGSNGFLVLRQFGSTYAVNPAATIMTATSTGWGATWSSRSTDIENGSVTVMVIQSAVAPVPDVDVDSDNDGQLDGVAAAWTIHDAIGNIDGGAADTAYGFFNTSGNGQGRVPPGATFINLNGYHPDYMARIGNSTGSSGNDWVVAELSGSMPTVILADNGFTRPASLEGAALNHIGSANNFGTGGDTTPPSVLSIDDNASGAVLVGVPLTYTITFNEDINAATVLAADFDNSGTATVSIGAIAEPSPGVFTVVVTPTSSGTLRLRIRSTAQIADAAGNLLVVPVLDNTTLNVTSGTQLGAGDGAILGYRTDASKGFSFVSWIDLLPGTSINFWDSGYLGGGDGSGQGAGGGNWRASEGFLTWTNSTDSTLPSGTVVVIGNLPSTSPTTNVGSVIGDSGFDFSSSGDQILMGQGAFVPGGNPSTFNGTLIFGLDFNGNNTTWDAADNAQSSGLPSALNVANGNLAVTHVDNGQYTGSRTFSSVAAARAAALKSSNWTFENDGAVFGTLNGTHFTIGSEGSLTLDTEDPASTTLVGGWGTSTSVPGFIGNNYAFARPGTNSTATFTPTLTTDGQYEVLVNYSAHPNRASNAGLKVQHNGGLFVTTFDQRTGEGDFISVGTFNFLAGTSGQVVISAAGADGFVTADAVRFIRVGDLTVPPTAQLIRPTDREQLTAIGLNGLGNITIFFPTATTASIIDATPEFTLSGPGVNDVVINPVPFDVGDRQFQYTFTGNFVPGEVFVDFIPGSFEDASTLANVADRQSFTVTDGIVRITLDNTDATQTNTWASSGVIPGYVGSDYLFNFAGGAGRLTYRPPIATDGNYEVFVNYTDGPSRASNAAYEVVSQNGTSVRRVDQRTGGGTFQSIGIFNFIQGTSGSVTLRAADADGVVVGDAIKFVRVGDLTGTPTASLADPLAGTTIVVTTMNGRDYIDVTFEDTSGAGLNLATITDSEAEFTLSGPGAVGVTLNGAATPIGGTTFRYATTGDFIPGAVDAVFAAGTFADLAGNENLDTIASFVVAEDLIDEVIVDNSDPAFAVSDPTQFLTSSNVSGFIGVDYLAAPVGSTATATWKPKLAADGDYEVYVRYTSHPMRATNATYVVTHDGGTNTLSVDQTAGGGMWVLLGTFSLSDGLSSVQLQTRGANQFVVADAVRFVRL